MTMPAIDLYWFSGTGNTLIVAEAMAGQFAALGVETRLIPIESADPAKIRLDRALGLAFPVAAFSTYPFVWKFFEALPKAAGTLAFMVDTLGGNSGGIVGPLRQLLEGKGYAPVGAKEIRMPGNFMVRASETKEQNSVFGGVEAAKAYARELAEGNASWGKGSALSDIACRISRGITSLWGVKQLRFIDMKVDEGKCTKCGLCVRSCPVKAIAMDGYPRFSTKCEFCQRCAGICPAGAIRMKGSFMAKPYLAVPSEKLCGDGN